MFHSVRWIHTSQSVFTDNLFLVLNAGYLVFIYRIQWAQRCLDINSTKREFPTWRIETDIPFWKMNSHITKYFYRSLVSNFYHVIFSSSLQASKDSEILTDITERVFPIWWSKTQVSFCETNLDIRKHFQKLLVCTFYRVMFGFLMGLKVSKMSLWRCTKRVFPTWLMKTHVPFRDMKSHITKRFHKWLVPSIYYGIFDFPHWPQWAQKCPFIDCNKTMFPTRWTKQQDLLCVMKSQIIKTFHR